ncbi:hypothetical protein ACWGR3_30865, partial [Streptomyces albidoflavus]
FALLGWSLTGPSEVAQASAQERGRLYFESLAVRCVSAALMIAVGFVLASLLETASVLATWLSSSGMILIGLGAAWFYVGELEPARLFLFDTIPRAIAIVSATVTVALQGGIVTYSAIVALGPLIAGVTSALDIRRRYRLDGPLFRGRSPLSILLGQRHAIATGVLTTTYQSAPVAVLQALSPSLVPLFALMDKIRMQSLTAYKPVSQVFQGWVPQRDGSVAVRERAMRVLVMAISFGIIGSIALALAAPILVGVLSAGRFDVDFATTSVLGVAFGSAIVSMTVGPACLIPLGRARMVTISALCGTVVTFTAILVLGGIGSTFLAMTAIAMGQLSVAAVQIFACITSPKLRQ